MQEPTELPEDPGLPPMPGPIMEFKGAYPFDTQSVLEVTPDNSRAFVAEGAGITILDLNSISGTPPMPRVIDQVALPDASPRSLLYYEHPVSHDKFLFVAGGTMGLWRMKLCPPVLIPPPDIPSACICSYQACDPYFRTRIDIVEDVESFQRKRCVDMAIVEGNAGSGGVPILCVIYSARGDTPSPFGPTELRAYLLNEDGTVVPYGDPYLFSLQYLLPAPPPEHLAFVANAVGNAIVSDPGDQNSVYVSMGTMWLYKVDLTTSSFTASRFGPDPYGCPLPSCAQGEQMRDLTIVSTPQHGSVIYAPLDYGRILEYQIGAGTPTMNAFPVSTTNGTERFPSRIDAVSSGEKVLIGLGLFFKPGTRADTEHTQTTGGWTGYCQGSGVDDPNGPPDGPPHKGVNFYIRDLTVGNQPTLIGAQPGTGKYAWGSVVLRHSPQTGYWSYESAPLIARRIIDPFGAPEVGVEAFSYAGNGISPADGTVSVLNPNVTYFGFDGLNAMMHVSPDGELKPIRDARLCEVAPETNLPNCAGLPNPFIYSSVLAVGNLADPDGENEWFVSGGPMYRLVDRLCMLVPNDSGCNTSFNPCGSGPWYWKKESTTDGLADVGWFLVKMKTRNIVGNPPSAAMSEMKWWQLNPPASTTGERAEAHGYLLSHVDPRTTLVNGIPQPLNVYCIRTGTNRGVKIFKTADLIASTTTTCPPGASPGPGYGEYVTTPPLIEAITHIELEPDTFCRAYVTCAGEDHAPNARNWYNHKSDVFLVTDRDGFQRWVIAVTQGFVASGPDPFQPPSCAWAVHYGKPLVGFYDVTDPFLQPYPPPPPGGPLAPIRVALGTVEGHAWAVKTKTYSTGETYAFVADTTGKLLIFDVSGPNLFDPTTSPYNPADALSPVATYTFPGDPSDLMPANCWDLEVDGDLLYCALARAGIGIVDVSGPTAPRLIYLIDTPGLVEGLARRTVDGRDQFVVGDTRCGMRLYGRLGE